MSRKIRPYQYEVIAFFDTSCGFCTKMHEEIDTYLDAGITIHYAGFARGGGRSPAYEEMISLWCADEPEEVLNAHIHENKPIPDNPCSAGEVIDEHYELGNDMGLRGTPTVYDFNGQQVVGGYAPADRMLRELNND